MGKFKPDSLMLNDYANDGRTISFEKYGGKVEITISTSSNLALTCIVTQPSAETARQWFIDNVKKSFTWKTMTFTNDADILDYMTGNIPEYERQNMIEAYNKWKAQP